jgi:cytochrome c peroxidase
MHRGLGLVALPWVLAACGGAGSGGAAPSPVAAPPPPPNRTPFVARPNTDRDAVLGAAFLLDTAQGGTTFVDDDGDALAVTVTLSDTTHGLMAAGAIVSGTPTRGGRLAVTVTASDGRGGSADDRFDLLLVPGRTAKLARPVLPATPFAYSDASAPLPAHFRTQAVTDSDNTPATNPITDAGATLGRVLFYDTRLSAPNNVSCGSCHQQAFGFSDPAVTSEGFAGGRTPRHSTGLANARFYGRGRMFWDERAATIEEQALIPIENAVEMGMTLAALETKLAATDFYPPLFAAAFGTGDVTRDRIGRALAQFVRALASTASTFDGAFNGGATPNFAATFTPQEQLGQRLFSTPPGGPGRSARCTVCHVPITHSIDFAHNIGLDAVPLDAGAGGGRFKSPSLRNIAIRAPYMHDGRFATLEEVIEHYDNGVQFSPNLSPALVAAPGQPLRLGLTAEEKAALVAFLNTLTDVAFLTDPRFADPFPLQ